MKGRFAISSYATRQFSGRHYIDYEWLERAYQLTRKDGAVGTDGVTAEDYAVELAENLIDLLDRIKSGRYQAPLIRRTYIPKADGSQRPLGIPAFEDKIVQRAVVMLLEPIFEQDFYDCSYGFRPQRSAHLALHNLRSDIMGQGGRYILDVDLEKYFDKSISTTYGLPDATISRAALTAWRGSRPGRNP